MVILGIETSHDDSSVALLKNGKVIKMATFSQINIHAKYGGTIPEIASREHVNNVAIILEEFKSLPEFLEIDYVAYTKEPGLIGALHIGYLFASAISMAINKPLIPINHLYGHIFSVAIDNEITYPALALLVSGGHSQLIFIKNPLNFEIIGQTLDDAVGEVYDKVARKLDLGFPGGPAIDQLAQNLKIVSNVRFSIPKTQNLLDMSFSGIKTQVINLINHSQQKQQLINSAEIAHSFQTTIVEYLRQKLNLAIKVYQPKTIILAGGVSANKAIREMFLQQHPNALIPIMQYTTDNGAMIAKAAEVILNYEQKQK
ncbi:tRNA (adenosine(37)-N6)-threonylcarbamoyltransferase complex transferase subunit TsaD [Candidatus Mycoplasma pogonae]